MWPAEGNCTAKFIDANHTGVLQSGDTNATQYVWDAGGRLVQVTQSETFGTPTQIVTYLYDAEGRWIGENIANGSGVVTHETRFVYDGNQIVLQFDENGSGAMTTANLSHRYLWGPAVDQLLSDEQLSPLPPGEGQGEGSQGYNVSTPGTVVWPLTDNVGTVRDLAICNSTTGTTAVVNHLTYGSFGQLLTQTDPATGNVATVVCVFGFTGRPFDTNTGVQNNLNRWYDPSLGRWISEDPTGFAAGDTNDYRYVENSPANGTDPTGQELFVYGKSMAEKIAERFKKEIGVTPLVVWVKGSYYDIIVKPADVPAVQKYVDSLWFFDSDKSLFASSISTGFHRVYDHQYDRGLRDLDSSWYGDLFDEYALANMAKGNIEAGYSREDVLNWVQGWMRSMPFRPYRPPSLEYAPQSEADVIVHSWTKLADRGEWLMLIFGPGGMGETALIAASGFRGGFSVPPGEISLEAEIPRYYT